MTKDITTEPIRTGERIFISGIGLDLLITIIGVSFFEVAEGHPAGLSAILVANTLVILMWSYLRTRPWPNLRVNHIVATTLTVVGSFRFAIGIINIITILSTIW
jgi:hypothetical protein